jgi:NAD(P)-dependent dehydrogenase (short-subunit alcohol dehydrogenase family)
MDRHVLVTGASSGIGFALCKVLARDHSCCVLLGARDASKGQSCADRLLAEVPSAAGRVQVVQLDVTDQASIAAAAASLKCKGVVLYALVNNAGVGLAQPGAPSNPESILDTNLYGVKRVTEALLPLIDPSVGRIVNVSSGAASAYLKNQDAATKALFSNPSSWEALEAGVMSAVAKGNVGLGNGYGLSKAALSAYTVIQAKMYPNLTVVSLSPGFIDTPMTAGFGAKLTPEQGCTSSIKCLFGAVSSGFYYGSDGLRSPLTIRARRSRSTRFTTDLSL